MPELPEVETICNTLKSNVRGSIIKDVGIKTKKLRYKIQTRYVKEILNNRIQSILRRGKYILFFLSGNFVLLFHMGMSGSFSISDLCSQRKKHDHILFTLENLKRKKEVLAFNDPRKFGCFIIVRKEKISCHRLLHHLGLEPLDDQFNGKTLFNILRDTHSLVKSALMNQNKIVGIGNIYACEALFDAGISPQRDAADINIREAKKLTASIKKILTKAIKSGGSSLVNYKNVDGKMGYFQNKFSVYKREGEDCKICSKKDTKNSKIVRLKILGRSTYFCPTCQL